MSRLHSWVQESKGKYNICIILHNWYGTKERQSGWISPIHPIFRSLPFNPCKTLLSGERGELEAKCTVAVMLLYPSLDWIENRDWGSKSRDNLCLIMKPPWCSPADSKKKALSRILVVSSLKKKKKDKMWGGEWRTISRVMVKFLCQYSWTMMLRYMLKHWVFL